MAETPDSIFLKTAVAKGLVEVEMATALYREAHAAQRPVAELLIERQILTAYQVTGITKDVDKANGPKIIAGFQIIDKLGQGGMGAVYRATQLSIGRQVALKIMAPEVAKNKIFVERFLREARAMGAINHPHVITCFDVGNDGKILYMALELMTGGDADQLARSFGGILPAARACAIVRDCAAGLEAIHAVGLIHRDIKPANIFLGESGAAKLADLGLARQDDGQDQMTRTGTAMGTPAFMSPEQAQGIDDLDIRSDIYALGATLFALTTGQPPFTGQSAYAIVAKVIHEAAPDPRSLNPNVPESVVQVIRAAMHKDRKKRPQTPRDLQLMLTRCYDDLLAAGMTESTIGALPASLVSHPTPLTHVGPGNRSHRTHISSTSGGTTASHGRRVAVGAGIFVAIATVSIIGIAWLTPSAATLRPTSVSQPEPIIVRPLPIKIIASPVVTIKPLTVNDAWPEQATWILTTAALAADQQLQKVMVALGQLNPGFDGKHQFTIEPASGQVTSLILSAAGLDDLRPLQALKNLQTLVLGGGTVEKRGPLFQLASLHGLTLSHLALPWTMVEDLTPLAGMPLIDVDLSGSIVSDITPVLSEHLQKLAFSTDKVRRGVAPLRALSTVKNLGISWDQLMPAASFWQAYDAGELPGVNAQVTAKETPVAAPVGIVAPGLVIPAEAIKPPSVVAIEALIIPENAQPKVRALAKAFNESTAKLLAGLGQRRKDASRVPLKTVGDDYYRSSQKALKDPAQLGTAMATGKVKFALENDANARASVFTDPLLLNTTLQALADWRAAIEPFEIEAAEVAEDRRQKALKELEPFVSDVKSGASELITQLQGMVPTAPTTPADSEPVPVDGAIWRIECMTALPHDTLLRDLTGTHSPARVIGELGETVFGKALRGDGRNTQITVTLKRTLAARTLMAWVNITSDTLAGGVIGVQSPDGTHYESIMYNGGEQGWGIATANAKRSLTASAHGSEVGGWRHLAMVVDGAKRTLFYNGKILSGDQAGETTVPAGSELIIGKRNSGRDERHFAGLIDGALVFDRALSNNDIKKIMDWQFLAGEQIRLNLREREWINVPVGNGDFSKVTSTGRPAEWQSRGEGISSVADADGRYLRLEQSKAGQDARVARQVLKLEPTWRAIRLQVRLREPKPLELVPGVNHSNNSGVCVVLDDANGGQPTLRRRISLSEEAQPGVWSDCGDRIGWPIPPGYTLCTLECSMRGYLGQLDIDDLKVSALVGKP